MEWKRIWIDLQSFKGWINSYDEWKFRINNHPTLTASEVFGIVLRCREHINQEANFGYHSEHTGITLKEFFEENNVEYELYFNDKNRVVTDALLISTMVH